MSPQSPYSRLSSLIASLSPYLELAPESLTKEIENHLLITLSQVFVQVKQWTHEFDSDSDSHSDEDSMAMPADNSACSDVSTSYSDNGNCLAMVDLMALLAAQNQYIQHLAGNTFVAISEFVIASDSSWDDFMHFMCLCLEWAICNNLSCSLEPNAFKSQYLDYLPISISLLKLKLRNTNWLMVAAIFRILRNILKLLRDFDDNFIKQYLDFIGSFISNVPWDLLNEVFVGHNAEASRSTGEDISHHVKAVQPKEAITFYGNLLQFFCSLVEQSNLLEVGVDSLSVICKIRNLVPKLLSWCHSELQSSDNVRISQYFRHKVLMLMVKLSLRIHLEYTLIISWLHLVYEYFEDLLLLPIPGEKFEEDYCLEGSPFCTSIFNPGKQNVSSRHLQRLAVFLFLRCSLSLLTMKASPDKQCACERLEVCTTLDLNLNSECCSKSKGLIELHKWLLAHVPADIFLDHEMYSKRCLTFTLSFVQLYMHEDDILFEVLLQLFCMPFHPDPPIRGGCRLEVKNHKFFLASDLFNPIHIFHIFLAEILYDHQVLLDYLISKDRGASCAEYLLRSLRVVCDSWNLFVKYPETEEAKHLLYSKRRKVLAGCLDSDEALSSPRVRNDGAPSSLEMECKKVQLSDSKHGRNYRLPFVGARDCLVSLKTSIESLCQKNLFPYNPQALLLRLIRFQELCFKQ
ncbi:unnamed protein product [Fraxinus pennsylvanica]|uniref:Uncharacterized protein n=1 Tax=Fraxinus pennsylvanica TaxID=56036 RepID=A0AAD1ZXC0_9LAMI|nr:unnamed protein product [Fraxinus pennsylvanica]